MSVLKLVKPEKEINLGQLETELNGVAVKVYRGDIAEIGKDKGREYGNGISMDDKEIAIVIDGEITNGMKIEAQKVLDEHKAPAVVDLKAEYAAASTATAKIEVIAKKIGLIDA